MNKHKTDELNPSEEICRELAIIMEEISRYHMPFGKYGPDNYPPDGVPLYDLPYPYLAYFKKNSGFPNGKLGKLMEFIYHAKLDGADAMFEPLRERNGGRTRLHSVPRKEWEF